MKYPVSGSLKTELIVAQLIFEIRVFLVTPNLRAASLLLPPVFSRVSRITILSISSKVMLASPDQSLKTFNSPEAGPLSIKLLVRELSGITGIRLWGTSKNRLFMIRA